MLTNFSVLNWRCILRAFICIIGRVRIIGVSKSLEKDNSFQESTTRQNYCIVLLALNEPGVSHLMLTGDALAPYESLAGGLAKSCCMAEIVQQSQAVQESSPFLLSWTELTRYTLVLVRQNVRRGNTYVLMYPKQ